MMKRVLFPALFFILLTGASMAQNQSFMGLCLGTTIPQGTYAEKDFYKEGAGYANTGFLFTFDGAIFPDDYLGIGATVAYGSNNPDKDQYKADIIKDFTTRYPDLEYNPDDIYFDFGVWRYLNLHAGPAFTVGAGSFNFDFRALAGATLAWAPNQLFQMNLPNEGNFSRKVNDKAVTTLGFTLGTGFRYQFNNGYVIRLTDEYSGSKPTMEVTEDILESINNDQEVTTTQYKMPIKNIQIGFGVAYNFEL